MVKGIMVENEMLLNNSQLREKILSKFNGISFAGNRQGFDFWFANKDVLNHSLSLNGTVLSGRELRPYADELFSYPTVDNKDFLNQFDKPFTTAIVGEADLSSLKKVNHAKVTYTIYRNVITIPIINLRIPIPFFSQLLTWKYLQKKYNERFSMCIINLVSNEQHFDELIKWGTTYNKEIWFYAPKIITVPELINQINKLKL